MLNENMHAAIVTSPVTSEVGAILYVLRSGAVVNLYFHDQPHFCQNRPATSATTSHPLANDYIIRTCSYCNDADILR